MVFSDVQEVEDEGSNGRYLMNLRVQLFKDVAYEHIILNTQQLCDPLGNPNLQRTPEKNRGGERRN